MSSERLRTNGIWARKARGIWISLSCCKGKSCGGHRTPQVLVFGRLRYNTRILSAYLATSPGWGPIRPMSLKSQVSEVLQQRVWKWGSRVLKNHSYTWQSCRFPWDNLSHCLEIGGLYFPGGKTYRFSWTLHMKYFFCFSVLPALVPLCSPCAPLFLLLLPPPPSPWQDLAVSQTGFEPGVLVESFQGWGYRQAPLPIFSTK